MKMAPLGAINFPVHDGFSDKLAAFATLRLKGNFRLSERPGRVR